MLYTVLVRTSQSGYNSIGKGSEEVSRVIRSIGHLPIKMWQCGLQFENVTVEGKCVAFYKSMLYKSMCGTEKINRDCIYLLHTLLVRELEYPMI